MYAFVVPTKPLRLYVASLDPPYFPRCLFIAHWFSHFSGFLSYTCLSLACRPGSGVPAFSYFTISYFKITGSICLGSLAWLSRIGVGHAIGVCSRGSVWSGVFPLLSSCASSAWIGGGRI